MSENVFAISDVDMDGKDELVIGLRNYRLVNIMYDYDSSTNKFREQFREYCGMNFYENGTIEVDLSHDQGTAGGILWPYKRYSYNNDTDTYELTASVDAWNKSFTDNNLILGTISEEFPKEFDKDNDGVVYYIKTDDNNLTRVVDLKEYTEWRSQYITDETIKIEMPYMNFTKENIDNIII